jgi:hypothetical protein
MTDRTPPWYDLATVEGVVLQVAAEFHPRRLSADDLAQQVVTHPGDGREAETVAEAIRNLCEFGLLRDGGNGAVEATPAALRAVGLLGGAVGSDHRQ